MNIKQADAKTLAKLAEVDTRDADAAFELGFMKAAQQLGLNETEYQEFYKIACERLNQATAKKA